MENIFIQTQGRVWVSLLNNVEISYSNITGCFYLTKGGEVSKVEDAYTQSIIRVLRAASFVTPDFSKCEWLGKEL